MYGSKSIHHIYDIVLINDFLSRNLCSVDLLNNVIRRVIVRSSKKGALIRALKLITKIPAFIKSFLIEPSKGFDFKDKRD